MESSMEKFESTKANDVNKSIMRKAWVCDLVVRALAFALTLVAAIVVGVDKQTKVVQIKLIDSLPPLSAPLTAKWHYLSAFVYFVVANAIASAYAFLTLMLGLRRRSSRMLATMVIVIDALMVALLFSGNGATMAIGLIGLQGNSHVHWNKVCNVFGKFCDQLEAALAFSLLASMAFIILLLLPLLRLHHQTTN